jgi:hypothetical protein
VVVFSKPTSVLATAIVKGEPLTKHTWEGDEAVPMVKEDDVVPVVKEDDVVPVVNQDEAPMEIFGDRDHWAIDIMRKAFLKIRRVL